MPERARKFANVVLCLTAVFGIGWGGKEIWLVLSNRHQIDAACADLVPAGRILALSPAGGKITGGGGDAGIQLDRLWSGQKCDLFSTEAGKGRGSGAFRFFTGAVGVSPGSQRVVADGPLEDLLDFRGGPTYPQQPLGGGIAGVVGGSGVVVRLPCAEGEVGTRSIKALWARAELTTSNDVFTEKGQLSGSDRSILADTAVSMANNLAERLGCDDRLADAPDDVPALPEGPVPADRAEGTCAWYAKTGYARQGRYPDQALESRTDAGLWDEQCGLILSEGRATGLYMRGADEREIPSEPDRPGKWFVSLHTYAGADARNVWLTSRTTSYEKPEPAEPGRAGRSAEDPIWWASSVCDGQPQIHTMSLAMGYDRLVTPEMAKVFRAYVEDVTHRRGCTDVTFPAASSFRER
ncbi:hypothetical protein ACIREE_18020 [Streptomyces sp. NPDC102467]|uniref:hypothetical protein n=1 Tax=Streptomyces sp. NPDC102467 TaxID=3366179 RepID=UPI0038266D4D